MMCVSIARSQHRSPSSSSGSQSCLPHSMRGSPPQMSLTRMSSVLLGRSRRRAPRPVPERDGRPATAMPSPPRAVTISAVSSMVSGRSYSERRSRVVRPVQYTVAPASPRAVASHVRHPGSRRRPPRSFRRTDPTPHASKHNARLTEAAGDLDDPDWHLPRERGQRTAARTRRLRARRPAKAAGQAGRPVARRPSARTAQRRRRLGRVDAELDAEQLVQRRVVDLRGQRPCRLERTLARPSRDR